MGWQSMNHVVEGLSRRQIFRGHKNSATAEGAGTYHSLWRVAGQPNAGALPAVASAGGEIVSRATLGAIPFVAPTSGRKLKLVRLLVQGGTVGAFTLVDRVWQCSGLVLNTLAEQPVTAPPALTRHADGKGLELWGEVYTAGGATGATYSVKYTNQDGVAARVATYVQPANALSVGQMVRFDLQGDDYGVRAVESLTLSASTGVAGDFGLTILRPIITIGAPVANLPSSEGLFALNLPDVEDQACLAWQVLCSTTNTGLMHFWVALGEN